MSIDTTNRTDGFREAQRHLAGVTARGEKQVLLFLASRAPGWITGEMLGVARDRVVSVFNCPKESGQVRVKIVATKHNIYVGVPV